MMTKIFFFYNRIFESNQNFTTEHVKIVKISGFFSDFCLKFQVFFKTSQIPDFSRFPGKVATLYFKNLYVFLQIV